MVPHVFMYPAAGMLVAVTAAAALILFNDTAHLLPRWVIKSAVHWSRIRPDDLPGPPPPPAGRSRGGRSDNPPVP